MAEITRRRVGELVRGVMEILRHHSEGYAAKDLLKELEKKSSAYRF